MRTAMRMRRGISAIGGCRTHASLASRMTACVPRGKTAATTGFLPMDACTFARRYSSRHMQVVTSSSRSAVEAYDSAVSSYLSLSGDPVAALQTAIAADEGCLMAHVLQGWLFVLSTGCSKDHPMIVSSLAAARALIGAGVGTQRERAFARALACWVDGRLRASAAILEAILVSHPTDALTVRAAHDTYFFLGDSLNLRNGVARVLREWDPTMPEYDKLCGMLAFGMEENNQYAEAEEYGMQAINMNPNDAWGLHALVHVYEMQSRVNEGKRLLGEMKEYWEKANLFDHHIMWHECLYDIEDSEFRNAMGRYDGSMTRVSSDAVLNLVDDTSLLWRFELARRPLPPPLMRPIDASEPLSPRYIHANKVPLSETGQPWLPRSVSVPTRWTELVRRWQPFLASHVLAFNDIHVVMALVACGDGDGLDAQLASMRAYANAPDSPPDAWVVDWCAHPSSAHAASDSPSVTSSSSSSSNASAPLPTSAAASLLSSLFTAAHVPEPLVPVRVPADPRASLPYCTYSRPTAAYTSPKASVGTRQAGTGASVPGTSGTASSTGALGALSSLPPHVASLLSKADNRGVVAHVGLDMAEGMVAFWHGDYTTACTLLSRSQPFWHTIGGSLAQRDVFQQTLIHAAFQSGHLELARSYLSERVTLRFGSAPAWYMYGNSLEALGELGKATDAKNRSYALGLGQGGPQY